MKTTIALAILFSVTLLSCTSKNISASTPTPTATHSISTPSAISTETSKITQDKAVEVVKETCNSFRTVQREEPLVNQAFIISPDDAYKKLDNMTLTPSVEQFTTRMWFVELKGEWIGTGTFSGLTIDKPWNICEGLVDADSGEPIPMSFRWKKSYP